MEFDRNFIVTDCPQEFTSKGTTINSQNLPKLFKNKNFVCGKVNLDYGGGHWDNVTEWMEQELGCKNLIYDPFNRSKEFNQATVDFIREYGGADTVTCSNVLNVIQEGEARFNALSNIKKMMKPDGVAYFTMYRGDGSCIPKKTAKGFQLNRPHKGYKEELEKFFSDVKFKDEIVIARI